MRAATLSTTSAFAARRASAPLLLARPRPFTQCRVARPSAVLDKPTEDVATEAPAPRAGAVDGAAPPPPRRRRQPRRRADSGSDDNDSDINQQQQQQGPTFTPVESAASLILRGLAPSSREGGGAEEGVPLAVESAEGLAVAVLALSRAQHALRTERGLELTIARASTRRTGGSSGGSDQGRRTGPPRTSLRAVLRAGPCAPPTDRPVRRIDVIPGTARNAVVAAAVEALRAASPGQGGAAPVDLVARGASAASNALAALGLVRAVMLSGAAAFTPGQPPAWVGLRRKEQKVEQMEEVGQHQPEPTKAVLPPLDVVAVLDALPPARPAALAPEAPAPPHELVVRLRLSTCPPPAQRSARRDGREEEEDGGSAGPSSSAPPSPKKDQEEGRRERREKQAAVAELRAVAQQQQQGEAAAPSSSSSSSSSTATRRELNDLADQVKDLARMNAMILEMLEQQKRAEQQQRL
jgi:hypothetical protein